MPADGVLYLAGKKMPGTGTVRKFKVPMPVHSAPLTVKAELTRGGQVFAASSVETLVVGETVSVRVQDVPVSAVAVK